MSDSQIFDKDDDEDALSRNSRSLEETIDVKDHSAENYYLESEHLVKIKQELIDQCISIINEELPDLNDTFNHNDYNAENHALETKHLLEIKEEPNEEYTSIMNNEYSDNDYEYSDYVNNYDEHFELEPPEYSEYPNCYDEKPSDEPKEIPDTESNNFDFKIVKCETVTWDSEQLNDENAECVLTQNECDEIEKFEDTPSSVPEDTSEIENGFIHVQITSCESVKWDSEEPIDESKTESTNKLNEETINMLHCNESITEFSSQTNMGDPSKIENCKIIIVHGISADGPEKLCDAFKRLLYLCGYDFYKSIYMAYRPDPVNPSVKQFAAKLETHVDAVLVCYELRKIGFWAYLDVGYKIVSKNFKTFVTAYPEIRNAIDYMKCSVGQTDLVKSYLTQESDLLNTIKCLQSCAENNDLQNANKEENFRSTNKVKICNDIDNGFHNYSKLYSKNTQKTELRSKTEKKNKKFDSTTKSVPNCKDDNVIDNNMNRKNAHETENFSHTTLSNNTENIKRDIQTQEIDDTTKSGQNYEDDYASDNSENTQEAEHCTTVLAENTKNVKRDIQSKEIDDTTKSVQNCKDAIYDSISKENQKLRERFNGWLAYSYNLPEMERILNDNEIQYSVLHIKNWMLKPFRPSLVREIRSYGYKKLINPFILNSSFMRNDEFMLIPFSEFLVQVASYEDAVDVCNKLKTRGYDAEPDEGSGQMLWKKYVSERAKSTEITITDGGSCNEILNDLSPESNESSLRTIRFRNWSRGLITLHKEIENSGYDVRNKEINIRRNANTDDAEEFFLKVETREDALKIIDYFKKKNLNASLDLDHIATKNCIFDDEDVQYISTTRVVDVARSTTDNNLLPIVKTEDGKRIPFTCTVYSGNESNFADDLKESFDGSEFPNPIHLAAEPGTKSDFAVDLNINVEINDINVNNELLLVSDVKLDSAYYLIDSTDSKITETASHEGPMKNFNLDSNIITDKTSRSYSNLYLYLDPEAVRTKSLPEISNSTAGCPYLRVDKGVIFNPPRKEIHPKDIIMSSKQNYCESDPAPVVDYHLKNTSLHQLVDGHTVKNSSESNVTNAGPYNAGTSISSTENGNMKPDHDMKNNSTDSNNSSNCRINNEATSSNRNKDLTTKPSVGLKTNTSSDFVMPKSVVNINLAANSNDASKSDLNCLDSKVAGNSKMAINKGKHQVMIFPKKKIFPASTNKLVYRKLNIKKIEALPRSSTMAAEQMANCVKPKTYFNKKVLLPLGLKEASFCNLDSKALPLKSICSSSLQSCIDAKLSANNLTSRKVDDDTNLDDKRLLKKPNSNSTLELDLDILTKNESNNCYVNDKISSQPHLNNESLIITSSITNRNGNDNETSTNESDLDNQRSLQTHLDSTNNFTNVNGDSETVTKESNLDNEKPLQTIDLTNNFTKSNGDNETATKKSHLDDERPPQTNLDLTNNFTSVNGDSETANKECNLDSGRSLKANLDSTPELLLAGSNNTIETRGKKKTLNKKTKLKHSKRVTPFILQREARASLGFKSRRIFPLKQRKILRRSNSTINKKFADNHNSTNKLKFNDDKISLVSKHNIIPQPNKKPEEKVVSKVNDSVDCNADNVDTLQIDEILLNHLNLKKTSPKLGVKEILIANPNFDSKSIIKLNPDPAMKSVNASKCGDVKLSLKSNQVDLIQTNNIKPNPPLSGDSNTNPKDGVKTSPKSNFSKILKSENKAVSSIEIFSSDSETDNNELDIDMDALYSSDSNDSTGCGNVNEDSASHNFQKTLKPKEKECIDCEVENIDKWQISNPNFKITPIPEMKKILKIIPKSSTNIYCDKITNPKNKPISVQNFNNQQNLDETATLTGNLSAKSFGQQKTVKLKLINKSSGEIKTLVIDAGHARSTEFENLKPNSIIKLNQKTKTISIPKSNEVDESKNDSDEKEVFVKPNCYSTSRSKIDEISMATSDDKVNNVTSTDIKCNITSKPDVNADSNVAGMLDTVGKSEISNILSKLSKNNLTVKPTSKSVDCFNTCISKSKKYMSENSNNILPGLDTNETLSADSNDTTGCLITNEEVTSHNGKDGNLSARPNMKRKFSAVCSNEKTPLLREENTLPKSELNLKSNGESNNFRTKYNLDEKLHFLEPRCVLSRISIKRKTFSTSTNSSEKGILDSVSNSEPNTKIKPLDDSNKASKSSFVKDPNKTGELKAKPNMERHLKAESVMSRKREKSVSRNKKESKALARYGLKESFLSKHNIKLPLTSSVVVRNIPTKVDEVKLREVFSMAGGVKYVDITRGLLLSKATIQFYHLIEAVQAVCMFHTSKLDNHELSVSMAKRKKVTSCVPEGLTDVKPGLGVDGKPLKHIPALMAILPIQEKLSQMNILRKVKATERNPFKYEYSSKKELQKKSDASQNVKKSSVSKSSSNKDCESIKTTLKRPLAKFDNPFRKMSLSQSSNTPSKTYPLLFRTPRSNTDINPKSRGLSPVKIRPYSYITPRTDKIITQNTNANLGAQVVTEFVDCTAINSDHMATINLSIPDSDPSISEDTNDALDKSATIDPLMQSYQRNIATNRTPLHTSQLEDQISPAVDSSFEHNKELNQAPFSQASEPLQSQASEREDPSLGTNRSIEDWSVDEYTVLPPAPMPQVILSVQKPNPTNEVMDETALGTNQPNESSEVEVTVFIEMPSSEAIQPLQQHSQSNTVMGEQSLQTSQLKSNAVEHMWTNHHELTHRSETIEPLQQFSQTKIVTYQQSLQTSQLKSNAVENMGTNHYELTHRSEAIEPLQQYSQTNMVTYEQSLQTSQSEATKRHMWTNDCAFEQFNELPQNPTTEAIALQQLGQESIVTNEHSWSENCTSNELDILSLQPKTGERVVWTKDRTFDEFSEFQTHTGQPKSSTEVPIFSSNYNDNQSTEFAPSSSFHDISSDKYCNDSSQNDTDVTYFVL